MNHTYRLLYNAARSCWVAAPEIATARGKAKATVTVIASVLAVLASPAYALNADTLPSAGRISAGSGTMTTVGNTLTVTQSSQRMAVNWQSFSVGADATVNFVQPSRSAVALNRVVGSNPSAIYGHLNANGQVFLLNSNGILFGRSAAVSVGGLVASTLNLSDADFMAGNNHFSGSAGRVLNQGTLSAADGGYVALLGGQVSNEGTITAHLGNATLAAGSDMTLDFAGDGLIGITVNRGAVNALAENHQLVQADGGRVLMTAKAADQLVQAAVNNDGVIEAHTVENRGGVITLLGDMDNGAMQVGGTLDASAPAGGHGGFIETSAQDVRITDGARVEAGGGQWLIDPTNITIDAATAATLATSLDAGTDVTETTASAGTDVGDITVASAISWSGTGTLTLTADHDIAINAAISGANGGLTLSASHAISAPAAVSVGTFTLNAGTWSQLGSTLPAFSASDFRLTGGTFIRALGGDGSTAAPYQLADIYGVQGIGSSGMRSHSYRLANDIDASGSAAWNGGAGFNPLGDGTTAFTGSFDGQNHTLTGLAINRTATDNVGLFGVASGATVSNLTLTGGTVSGHNNVGALIGTANSGTTVSNVHNSSTVTGAGSVGGIAGVNGGTISDAHNSGAVTGTDTVGGLVGNNGGGLSGSDNSGNVTSTGNNTGGIAGYSSTSVSNLANSGAVTGTSNTGGVIGQIMGGSFQGLANSATVNGTTNVGGVIGRIGNATTANGDGTSFSTTVSGGHNSGAVTGSGNDVGGLVGYVAGAWDPNTIQDLGSGQFIDSADVTITDAYNVGAVSGVSQVGGLAGHLHSISPLSNSYNAGAVTATGSYAGGIAGYLDGPQVSQVYNTADIQAAGTAGGLAGYMTEFGGPNTAVKSTIDYSYSSGHVTGGQALVGAVGGAPAISNVFWNRDLANQTSYGSGVTTAQLQQAATFNGWDLATNGGSSATWRIYDGQSMPLLRSFLTAVIVTANSGSRAYDGTTDALGATYTVTPNSLLLGAVNTVTTSSKDVGTYTVSAGGLFSTDNRGYDVQYVPGTVTITPKALTASSVVAASKVYDGTTDASVTGTLAGVVSGDTVSLDAHGTFDTKDVGSGKTVALALTGSSAGNYVLGSGSTTTTADITPKALNVTGATALSREYDGTTDATITGAALAGVVGGDQVNIAASGTFSDKNAGTGKPVTETFSISGADVGNYMLGSTTASTTSDITPKTITITGATVANKLYDGTALATVISPGSLTGMVAGETLKVDGSHLVAAFDNRNVGTGKSVMIIGYTLENGTGLVSNYQLANNMATTTADILPSSVIVGGSQASGNPNDDLQAAIGAAAQFSPDSSQLMAKTPWKRLRDTSLAKLLASSGSTSPAGNQLIRIVDGGLHMPK